MRLSRNIATVIAGLLLLAAGESTAPVPTFAVGDRWVYRQIDLWTGDETRKFASTVDQVVGAHVYLSETVLASKDASLVGRTYSLILDARTLTPTRFKTSGPFILFDFPLIAGKSWRFEYKTLDQNGDSVPHDRTADVEDWETVNVPAGTFFAVRVVHTDRRMLRARDGVFAATYKETLWYAPAIKRHVKRELISRDVRGNYDIRALDELIEFRSRSGG